MRGQYQVKKWGQFARNLHSALHFQEYQFLEMIMSK